MGADGGLQILKRRNYVSDSFHINPRGRGHLEDYWGTDFFDIEQDQLNDLGVYHDYGDDSHSNDHIDWLENNPQPEGVIISAYGTHIDFDLSDLKNILENEINNSNTFAEEFLDGLTKPDWEHKTTLQRLLIHNNPNWKNEIDELLIHFSKCKVCDFFKRINESIDIKTLTYHETWT